MTAPLNRPAGVPHPSPLSRFLTGPWGVRAAALLIVVSVWLVYQGTLGSPYFLDDSLSLLGNPTIHRLWPLSVPLHPLSGEGQTMEGRPILNLSFAVSHAFGGDGVQGHRALNIGIHACAALALLGILRRSFLRVGLGGRDGPAGALGLALGAALLWAVHPLQTESVTYIVQRAESLMGLFFLLTVYAFVRAAEGEGTGEREGSGEKASEGEGPGLQPAGAPLRPLCRAGWLALAVAACALGMGTKEVMAAAPVLLLLYDRTFVAGSFSGALRARPLAYAALAATWVLLAFLTFGAGNRGGTIGLASGVGPWGYALCQARGLFHYLRLCYMPVGQVFDYGPDLVTRPIDVLPQGLGVLLLLGLTVWAVGGGGGQAGRQAGFLGAWFFLILAPSSSWIGGYRQMLAEHRLYLPLAAVIVLTTVALRVLAGVRGAIAALLVLAIPFGIAAVRRNATYATELSLYGDTVAKRPSNPWAHCNWAYALGAAGRTREAIAEFQEAIRLKPDLADAHYNLGLLLTWQGRLPEAAQEFEAAVRARPNYPDALRLVGIVDTELGRPAAALPAMDRLNQDAPDAAPGWIVSGFVYLQLSRNAEAAARFQRAILLDPASAEAEYDLGLALEAEGRPGEALDHDRRALALRPDYAEADGHAGLILVALGRPAEAVPLLERALQLRPDYPEAAAALEVVRPAPSF